MRKLNRFSGQPTTEFQLPVFGLDICGLYLWLALVGAGGVDGASDTVVLAGAEGMDDAIGAKSLSSAPIV